MTSGYGKRILELAGGLLVSAVGVTMLLQANVGVDPWSVLHQGMAKTMHISYGTATSLVGAAAILIASLCGESFGLGTLGNTFVVAMLIDMLLGLDWIPVMQTVWSGVLLLLGGMEVLTIGTWLYMKSGFGEGPRDGMMVALAKKTGRSLGFCRVVLEVVIVVAGWVMGGQVGIGTVISAVGLGALINFNFARLHFNAAAIHQENVLETFRNIRKALRQAAEK